MFIYGDIDIVQACQKFFGFALLFQTPVFSCLQVYM